MMSCSQCQGIEKLFDEQMAARELSIYRSKGADKTTRMMIAALKKEGVRGLSLLDLGGGGGAVQHELLESGVDSATDVDASRAYLNAAREEAQRRGLDGRVRYQFGDFVDIAAQIPAA